MRAIILAAGMGTRLRPLTLTTPKSLICVNGKPMMEQQIEYLKEKGIDEIIVVTGYLKEKFDYLVDKYHVKLVHNDKYAEYNNIYTMYLVRQFLADAYVLDGDIQLNRNVFVEKPATSLYLSAKKQNFKNEWMIRFNSQGKVKAIEIGDGNDDYIHCGLSYWSKDDAKIIVAKLEVAIASSNFKDLYWDNIVKDNISSLNIYLYHIKSDDVYEIDTLDELRAVEMQLNKSSIAGMKPSLSLFSKPENQFLEENRHRDSKSQQAYDSRFGLVAVGSRLK